MGITIFHLSDLHFCLDSDSGHYSMEQLVSADSIYQQLNSKLKSGIDRVLVTGDVTDDGKKDSFEKAKTWLMSKQKLEGDVSSGLNIDDDKKLKVLPGNRDFDFSLVHNKQGLNKYFDGLETYNRVFTGNHLFSDKRPLLYDWFELGKDVGVFILYLNTSFLGDDDSNLKLKAKFIDFTCEHVQQLVHKGTNGLLPRKAGSTSLISGDLFRQSFKIVVSHHSLQSASGATVGYLSEELRTMFLSNLGILDFQIQLSGHGHVYESPENTYYSIFDNRAKNRYAVNQLKNILGLSKSNAKILKSDDGRKFSRAVSLVLRTLLSLIDPLQNNEDRSILDALEKFANDDKHDILQELQHLLKHGRQRHPLSEQEMSEMVEFLSGLDESRRKNIELKARNIQSLLLKAVRRKSMVNFNAGSAGVPHEEQNQRHFNVYKIEEDGMNIVFSSYHYCWNAKSKEFEPNRVPDFRIYGRDKVNQART